MEPTSSPDTPTGSERTRRIRGCERHGQEVIRLGNGLVVVRGQRCAQVPGRQRNAAAGRPCRVVRTVLAKADRTHPLGVRGAERTARAGRGTAGLHPLLRPLQRPAAVGPSKTKPAGTRERRGRGVDIDIECLERLSRRRARHRRSTRLTVRGIDAHLEPGDGNPRARDKLPEGRGHCRRLRHDARLHREAAGDPQYRDALVQTVRAPSGKSVDHVLERPQSNDSVTPPRRGQHVPQIQLEGRLRWQGPNLHARTGQWRVVPEEQVAVRGERRRIRRLRSTLEHLDRLPRSARIRLARPQPGRGAVERQVLVDIVADPHRALPDGQGARRANGGPGVKDRGAGAFVADRVEPRRDPRRNAEVFPREGGRGARRALSAEVDLRLDRLRPDQRSDPKPHSRGCLPYPFEGHSVLPVGSPCSFRANCDRPNLQTGRNGCR